MDKTFFSFITFLCVLFVSSFVIAADASGAAPGALESEIEAGRRAVESDAGLEEPRKQEILERYSEAGQCLREAGTAGGERARLAKMVETGPARLEELRGQMAELSKGKADKKFDALVASADGHRLDAAIGEEQTALGEARERYDRQMDTLSELTVGAGDVSGKIDARRKLVEDIAAELDTLSAEEPSRSSQARRISLETCGMLRREELALLALRRDNHNLLVELAQMERDVAEAEAARRQARFDALEKAAGELRGKEATEARQEAERHTAEAGALPAPFNAVVDETIGYRLEREDLAQREKAVSGTLAAAKIGLDKMEADFQRIRQRMEVVGTSRAMGDILRARRATLPSMAGYRQTSRERKTEITRATDRQIHIDEQLYGRETADDPVFGLVAELPSDLSEPERKALEEKARELIRARRDALNELQKVYGTYIGQLTALDLGERQLVSVAESYVEYIDTRLIRIPDPVMWEMGLPVEGAVWLLSPANWRTFADDVFSLAYRFPLPAIVLMGLFLFVLMKRKQAEAKLAVLSHDAGRIRDYSFGYFLEAAGLTLVLSAWPLFVAGIGYALALSPGAGSFTGAMGQGMFKTGLVLTGILFLLRANGPEGIGARHLRWSAPIREGLLREARWMLPLATPLGFFVVAANSDGAPPAVWPLGRIAFVFLMAIFLVFIYRMLHAGGWWMRARRERDPAQTDLSIQLHFLWFPLLLIALFGLAMASVFGYRTLSMYFLNGVGMTASFFIGLFLLKESVLRYLYIVKRRLRYEDAVRKLDELRAQRGEDGAPEDREEDGSSSLVEIPEPDLDALGDQARRLIQGGFLFCAVIGTWLIWNDLLLSLGFLTDAEFSLYATGTGDGAAQDVRLTLGDVIRALMVLIITVLAARNIPGLLEITLLQRLPLETGGRYAFTTLTQYVIVGAGTIAVLGALGVEWSNIQWLVAALSVGLGFGLQEIVANFVSGIILLFERPIRVGDVVTIGDTSGTVSRIRIRATTIVNWDRQELLVPNRELITGRLTNWTLSNKVTRIIVTVGAAYGSDAALGLGLLTEAARENPDVLADPAPLATFEEFGDNALTLRLRVYIASPDNLLGTTTALHQAINDKFNAAGISIAFPQRDVHLDAAGPLDIRVVSA